MTMKRAKDAKITEKPTFVGIRRDTFCEDYAIIDDEIIWYGSMNLLGKENTDDNLMRVINRDIAAELMEMTFGVS